MCVCGRKKELKFEEKGGTRYVSLVVQGNHNDQ